MSTHSDNPRWRVGRKVGRTIYLYGGLVGVMDTPALAQAAVDALNALDVEPPDECDDPGWDERTQDAPGRYGA